MQPHTRHHSPSCNFRWIVLGIAFAWTAINLNLAHGAGDGGGVTHEIDTGHSSVTFRVRHLMSKVSGRFKIFNGTVVYAPDKLEILKASATIDASSIDTDVKKRDDHLKTADFFDVAKYPTIEFTSSKITHGTGDSAKLEGQLTMHGVTKPITLDVEILGEGKDPWGNKKRGLSATTKINRKDFGLNWNKALETGGLLVGDEVEIRLDIESQAKSKQTSKN